MKKLISVLLLISLVVSLMSGISISAFATEDTAEPTEIAETTPPPADGEGTTPPPTDGEGTTPPADGEGTTPPPADGEGTTPPADGEGTTPPPADGEGTTPPPADGEGTTPPADGEGTTPPPADGEGTTPPPADGEGTTPPPADGEGTTPPPADGEGTTPPPADGEGTTPPPADGEGTTPPPADGEGTTPPPADGEGTTPPADGEGTTPPADGIVWSKAEGLVDGQEYIIAVENSDGTLSVLKNDGGNVIVASIASAAEATADMLWKATSADRGHLIQNGDTCLYYKNSSGTFATTDTSKANWKYDGTLFYVGSGESYIVISGGTMSITKSAADASAIVLFTTGSVGEGSGDESGTENDPGTEPPPAESASWAEDTSLTAGKTYIIGLKNADGTVSVLKDDGGKVIVTSIESIDKSDESMQWLAASGANGVSLQNTASTGDYLYYGDGMIRASAASNWSYESGVMKYDRAGTAYYATITTEAASAGTDSAAASTDVVIWSIGEGSSSEGGSGDESTNTGSDSSNGFNQTDKIAGLGSGSTSALFVDAGGYPLFISDSGVPSCDSMALTMTGEPGSYHIDTDKPNIIWTVSEGSPPYLKLAMDDKGTIKYLYIDDNGVVQFSTEDGYAFWNNGDGANLSYKSAGGTTYYIATMTTDGITTTTDAGSALLIYTLTGTSTGGGGTPPGTTVVDTEAPVITKQPEAIPFVHEGSGYPAPKLTIAAQLAEGVTANNLYFQWYVDGVSVGERTKIAVNADNSPVETSITLDSLKDQPVGVYNIYCEVSCNIRNEETGEPVAHTSTSTNVAFTVCKGVLENSFLTFSDVHETFTNVGGAIQDSITVNNGLVPALIICTGDWANAHYAGGGEDSENYATTMSQYISKLYAQVSGIDIIFLAGNHDNGTAAADATINAALGAEEDYDGAGLMYDSKVETDGTSAANDGLVIFGITYENLEMGDGTLSYEAILPKLEDFLKELEKDYNGELVVISSHTGLHQLADWAGQGNYNVPGSNKVVALLNEYADTMDIMFFFGHDHSKGEAELFYKPGDPITSTISYTDQTTETQTLGFSYGHAGYITNTIGGQQRYSLVTWDSDSIKRSMSVVNGNEIAELTYELARVAEPEPDVPDSPDSPEIPDDKPEDKPDDKPGDKPNKPDSGKNEGRAPKTGDTASPVLWIAVLILCAGSLAILPRKKHN